MSEYLLHWEKTITSEHLPGAMNYQADKTSNGVKDSSEWKLNPQMFHTICIESASRKCVGRSTEKHIDLFDCDISHIWILQTYF